MLPSLILTGLVAVSGHLSTTSGPDSWTVHAFDASAFASNCTASDFPADIKGNQCMGLSAKTASTEDECMQQCCGDATCDVWQWCPPNSNGCGPSASCWTGKAHDCNHPGAWVSRSRVKPTPPAPPPPPKQNFLSATFGSHMVLQRAPASALIWGSAASGTVVTTTFNGHKISSTAGTGSVWRVNLPPTPAGGPYNITFTASDSVHTAMLSDVMFGDVYVCGGQSNMQFSMGGNVNASSYEKEADRYPNIRLFTVGQATKSNVPLMDLQTIEQPWAVANAKSVSDGSAFNYFSAVCWFFGKNIYDGLGGKVPIGLISNNWGGTRVEQWMSPNTSLPCGIKSSGELYNAMIHPYTVGPMTVTGFTWYQGESDLTGDPNKPDPNHNYTCTQAAQITQWRNEFKVPKAFYAIVQLSTWHTNPALVAQLRDQQLATEKLIPNSNFAYATNADFGAGGNIHPPFKQHPGARLANAALSIVYKKPIMWRSPTYASAKATGPGELTVALNDVTGAGLVVKPAFNAQTEKQCEELDAKTPRTCAWAELQFNDGGMTWVNATVGVGSDKKTMVLTATPPKGASGIIASSYGWGAVPMMTVYRADMEGEDGQLPVLTWNRTLDEAELVLV